MGMMNFVDECKDTFEKYQQWKGRCTELEEICRDLESNKINHWQFSAALRKYRNKHRPESVSDVARDYVQTHETVYDSAIDQAAEQHPKIWHRRFSQALANEEN